MKSKVTGFLIPLILTAAFTVTFVPVACAVELSNGFTPIIKGKYTLSFLSSKPVNRKTSRQFAKLDEELHQVVSRAGKLGVKWEEPVHVRIWEDLSFPASDIWKSYGVVADDAFFRKLRERIELSYAIVSMEELSEWSVKNLRDFPFLSRLPIPFEVSQRGIDALRGDVLDSQLQEADKYIEQLKESLDAPFAEVSRFYYVAKSACYEPQNAIVWVPKKDRKHRLHRDWDTILHEVGHHAFMQLFKQTLEKNNRSEDATPLALALLVEPLLPLNEFFADYTSVSNGNEMTLQMHKYKTLPDESKRYFSKERTLAGFLEEASGAGENSFYYEEGHNSLNPSRYFVWRLRLDIDDLAADRIVMGAVRQWLDDFCSKEIDSYPHKALRFEPGTFALLDYPQDILTVNKRFLRYLRREAQRILDEKGMKAFETIAEKIYNH